MKKDDIKSALGKIEPSEELIQATLLKIQKQKEKKSIFSVLSSFMSTPAYRYAGAFCALVLVVLCGVVVLGNNGNGNRAQNPSGIHSRNVDNAGVTSDTGINMVAFTLDDYENESTAMVKGKLKACFLSVETGEELADGSVASGALEIMVECVEDGAGYVTLDGAEGTSISAKIYFASQEEINTLVGLMSEEVYFSIVPEEKDGEAVWKVTDFSLERP